MRETSAALKAAKIFLSGNQKPCYDRLCVGDHQPRKRGSFSKGTARKIFLPRGSAQVVEMSRFGKANPRKSKKIQAFFFERFGRAPARFG
jgi:hypothetical protein